MKAGASPRYGTCVMPDCVAILNSSPLRCCAVPLPGDAKLTDALFSFKYARNSGSVLAGISGLTTSTSGTLVTNVMGAKSLTGS
ncbi:hypothetical protein D3C71_1760890 [compost metagenome]